MLPGFMGLRVLEKRIRDTYRAFRTVDVTALSAPDLEAYRLVMDTLRKMRAELENFYPYVSEEERVAAVDRISQIGSNVL
jgi:hypothetical protein